MLPTAIFLPSLVNAAVHRPWGFNSSSVHASFLVVRSQSLHVPLVSAVSRRLLSREKQSVPPAKLNGLALNPASSSNILAPVLASKISTAVEAPVRTASRLPSGESTMAPTWG